MMERGFTNMYKSNFKTKYDRILHFWKLEEYFSPHDYPFISKRGRDKNREKYFNKGSFFEIPFEQYKKENLKSKHMKYNKVNIYYGDFRLKNFLNYMIQNCNELEENEYEEIEKISGRFYIFTVQLDLQGKLTEEGIQISPFFYAVVRILQTQTIHCNLDIEELYSINNDINEGINRGNGEILNSNHLYQIKELIFKKLEIKDEESIGLYDGDDGKLMCKILKEDENTDDLASFYLDDIDMVHKNYKQNELIKKYITALEKKDSNKKWIDSDIDEIQKWLSVDRFPMAKYPSKFSPTLMQQLAINIATSEIDREENIFSVNGPPGTGKTTLLKEVIAANVEKTAEMLIKLGIDSPLFIKHNIDSNSNLDFTDFYYEIPEELAKYGILVASNNNKAVENITLDLPKEETVSKEKTHTDHFDARNSKDIYFTDIASKLMNQAYQDDKNEGSNRQAWGLISARMGKKQYINSVLECCHFKKKNEQNDKITLDSVDNYLSWEEAKNLFETAKREVIQLREKIKNDIEIMSEMYALEKTVKNQEQELDNKVKEQQDKENNLCRYISTQDDSEERIKCLEDEIKYIKNHSTLVQRIFIVFGWGNVAQKTKEIHRNIENLLLRHKVTAEKINLIKAEQKKLQREIKELENNISSNQKKYEKTVLLVNDLKSKYGDNYADKEFYKDIKLSKKSQNACPWTYAEYDKAREELFYRALQVRKAFILNSRFIKRNLYVYNNLNDNKYTVKERNEMFPHLFNALSIVIPVISTTFASVSNLLKYAGNQSLGTLVVDEAGQATPQSALGALFRSKRAIIVGDPLQVEPVVTIPEIIVGLLADGIGELSLYKDINNSVQLFADRINEFNGKIGEHIVGCPLVVHRRCIEPMFSISNRVSYDNRMFNMTSNTEPQKLLLDKSGWIHVVGEEVGNKNHFVKKQSDKVCELLENALSIYENLFDTEKSVFIISPFKTVVNGLKTNIIEYFGEKGFERELLHQWCEQCVGTVHTFQGKDANEVLFVLGCSSKSEGAMNWVSSKPNILNVACTRAKYRIVFIGNMEDWKERKIFNCFIPDLIQRINY